jgi:hypothetical protein
MENMDHTEAVRMQAVEKYILGELSPFLRAQFEEHYFDCADCALNLRAGVAFASASRQYFAELTVPARVVRAPRAGWFDWLKPMVAVPAFAALIAVIAYQNTVSIPNLRQEVGSQASTASTVAPWFSLANASVHGSSGTRIEIEPNQAFYLFFDITQSPRRPDSVFFLQVQDSAGKTLAQSSVSAERAQKSVVLPIPPGFREGDYKLVITDQAAGTPTPAGELPFTVAFSQQIQQH